MSFQQNANQQTQFSNNPPQSKQFNSEELKKLLSQDILDLELLAKTLIVEKKALTEKDTKSIDDTSKTKTALLNKIETRAKAKARLIANSGLNIKPGQVGSALEKLGDQSLIELWSESVEKLKQCKEKNQVNGTIISHSLSRTSKLMSIIRGQNNAPSLYGQKGKSEAYSQTQVLGKA